MADGYEIGGYDHRWNKEQNVLASERCGKDIERALSTLPQYLSAAEICSIADTICDAGAEQAELDEDTYSISDFHDDCRRWSDKWRAAEDAFDAERKGRAA